jgi:hypothetical protein
MATTFEMEIAKKKMISVALLVFDGSISVSFYLLSVINKKNERSILNEYVITKSCSAQV